MTTTEPTDFLDDVSLTWALTHIEKYGDSDFLPLPFEFKAIRHGWLDLLPHLKSFDLSVYRPKVPRRMLVLKPTLDFRIINQLDPVDAILYTALAYQSAEKVEQARISIDQKIACSYRIKIEPNGGLFSERNGWPDFHQRSLELSKEKALKYVIIADIADFYNQVSQHRVENALEFAKIDYLRSKNIEDFINALSAKQSRGIPVGPAASIVFAEACLSDVDTFLIRKGIKFTRYVDDFHIFTKTKARAVEALHDFTDYLYSAHRLVLNAAKTKIISVAEFLDKEIRDPELEERRAKSRRLQEMIDDLIADLGGYGAFTEKELEEGLSSKAKSEVARDSIKELFEECLSNRPLHLATMRYVLRKAGFLRTNVLLSLVGDNLTYLSPVFRDVCLYLLKTKKHSKDIGKAFVDFLRTNEYGGLAFSRLWGLEVLLGVDGMATKEDILEIARSSRNALGLRPMASVAVKFELIDWVREHKESWSNNSPQDKRSIIYSSSALPVDERNSWLRVVEESGDKLDVVVAKWIRGTARN